MTTPHDDSRALNETVQALDYMALAMRSSDTSAVLLAAFVWSQNDTAILDGTTSWLEQDLPPIIAGGGNVDAQHRVRPHKRPLHPPLPGAPFMGQEDIDKPLKVARVIVDTLKGAYKAALNGD